MSSNDPIVLQTALTRVGQNRLWTLKNDGLQGLIHHVKLSSHAYPADADLAEITELEEIIGTWPVIDGEQIGHNQFNTYAEFPYSGDNQPIRAIGFYLADGTLFAAYASPPDEIESYITNRTLLDAYFHLTIEAVPDDSLKIINTGIRFNPEIRESILSLMTQALDQNLQLAKLGIKLDEQENSLEQAHSNNQQLKQDLASQQQAFDNKLAQQQEKQQSDFELLGAGQMQLATEVLTMKINKEATP